MLWVLLRQRKNLQTKAGASGRRTLPDRYMSEYFPDWYERYPVALKDYDQYTSVENENAGKFFWNLTGENDPDHYSDMTPEEILEDLFGE